VAAAAVALIINTKRWLHITQYTLHCSYAYFTHLLFSALLYNTTLDLISISCENSCRVWQMINRLSQSSPSELETHVTLILARYSPKRSTTQATEVIFYIPVSKASSYLYFRIASLFCFCYSLFGTLSILASAQSIHLVYSDLS